ncbi:MAG: hypothetical protein O0V67_03760, partial [Methanocorpusculum sp.]|nr:hypothetical protein [Methanocorpusculum sp.]
IAMYESLDSQNDVGQMRSGSCPSDTGVWRFGPYHSSKPFSTPLIPVFMTGYRRLLFVQIDINKLQ